MKSWLPNIVAGAALHFLPESKMPNQDLRDRNCWPLQKLRSARWPPPSTRILQMPFSEGTRGSRQHSAKLCHCLRAEPCLGNWQLISVYATGSVRSPIFFVFFPSHRLHSSVELGLCRTFSRGHISSFASPTGCLCRIYDS